MINLNRYLKDGVSFEILDEKTYAITNNQLPDQLQQARQLLFKTIDERLTQLGLLVRSNSFQYWKIRDESQLLG